MIKPTGSERDVGHRRVPNKLFCFLYFFAAAEIRLNKLLNGRVVQKVKRNGVPFLASAHSAEVADPADVRSAVAYYSTRLKLSDCFIITLPIIMKAGFIVAREPNAIYFAVIREKLF